MSAQLLLPPVLDACCGPRMMWFDGADRRALFVDKDPRVIDRDWTTNGRSAGRKPAICAPDLVADFTDLPFPDESFYLVVLDPPHVGLSRTGKSGKLRKLYGVLIFKWAEHSIKLGAILELTPHAPLFGHRTVRSTHWVTWIKEPS